MFTAYHINLVIINNQKVALQQLRWESCMPQSHAVAVICSTFDIDLSLGEEIREMCVHHTFSHVHQWVKLYENTRTNHTTFRCTFNRQNPKQRWMIWIKVMYCNQCNTCPWKLEMTHESTNSFTVKKHCCSCKTDYPRKSLWFFKDIGRVSVAMVKPDNRIFKGILSVYAEGGV